MRKFFSIFVAVAMLLCLCIPAFAADTDSLASLLEGVDVNDLSDVELSSILEGLDLEGIDLDSIRESFSGSTSGSSAGASDALSGIADSIGSGDTSALSGITDSLGSLSDGATGTASTDSLLSGLTGALGSLTSGNDSTESAITDGVASALSGMFGGMDMSWLSDVVSDPSGILSMFTGGGASTGSSFDFNAIMDMISGAFGGNGLDLSALTSGLDLGSFDITSILGGLGGGDVTGGVSDKVAGISDMLKSGLESMGLDPSIADTLLDNDIVNFFANLFIGFEDMLGGGGDIGSMVGGLFGGDDSSSSSGGSDYSAPVTPNTGDNAAALAALGVLTAASCAAFVCLKKKRA